MKKSMKICLIVAVSLVLIGCMIFGGVMTMLKWDFSKLSTNKLETNTYQITEEFNNISINTQTSDIKILPSDDSCCKVICKEDIKIKHTVKVENNTLLISFEDNKKWFEYIGINFGEQYITVYLPKSECKALSIKSATGDIDIPKEFVFDSIDAKLKTGDVSCYSTAKELVNINLSTGDILLDDITSKSIKLSATTCDNITVKSVVCDGDISVQINTGYVNISDVKCNNFTSNGTTGDISLTDVIADTKIYVKRTTGGVKFNNSDANEIYVKTTTGNVCGNLLSDKIFKTYSTTGSINVPITASGGQCEIDVTTGDIDITVD